MKTSKSSKIIPKPLSNMNGIHISLVYIKNIAFSAFAAFMRSNLTLNMHKGETVEISEDKFVLNFSPTRLVHNAN